ncbi:ATP synthase complex assembly protein atp12 [Serendipita sp. 396]|nr:ATP synthase complex assembly protein atp12 [Serendipita sp. 396]KAG8832228.1 ATP synthase complex assembly protein atp12 [Serendipita sp. 400]KAG8853224.1 ATP synthase complex assembly protein atp12 [Serendipita sp. 411]KAG8868913.1 ATP synthase complex assembly protein atp12 [Serendipita sp. 405]KAG9056480.1 ATP synthase complex assembly protein atp12 [Serendipita sp. 407]
MRISPRYIGINRYTQIKRVYPSRQCASKLQAYATAANDAPPITQSNRAQTSMKRFWESAGTVQGDGYIEVVLDGRPLKTPDGNKLRVPSQKKVLATLIANEWDTQETLLKPHALPLTSIACRAIDGLSTPEDRTKVVKDLLRYFDTDTICYHEDEPEQLARLQAQHWEPLLKWSKDHLNLDVQRFDSLLVGRQSIESKERLFAILQGFDAWTLAGFERAVFTTKSAVISLALVLKNLSVERAAQASHVEVNSQIERWGEVEDSHDVDYQDIRRQLGSVACILMDS